MKLSFLIISSHILFQRLLGKGSIFESIGTLEGYILRQLHGIQGITITEGVRTNLQVGAVHYNSFHVLAVGKSRKANISE